MTPISFALEILLDCETIEKAHKACRKYIKKLESGQATHNASISSVAARSIPQGPVQAPSTQALLAAHGPLPPVPPRIIGGDVDNGDGTRGKRKF